MRSFVSLLATALFFSAFFLVATAALAATTYRIFGHGQPSASQRRHHAYMFNGRRVARQASLPVVDKNKSR
jgi:hypothetical protein